MMPGSASASLYWSNNGAGSGTTLGRAGTAGGGANQSFVTGAENPIGVAVDGEYVYWANSGTKTIGRARIDGTEVDPSFIPTGTTDTSLAVDSGHIYWGDFFGQKIGRASIDGGNVNGDFIATAGYPEGLAVDGSHVYWANVGPPNSIGRANLSGGEANQSFITTTDPIIGLALDGSHIYWATAGYDTIGRANLDGTGVNENFVTGAKRPLGVAVDSQHIYWTNSETGAIGRAGIDGSQPNQEFVQGANAPLGIAVDSLPHASATAISCTPASIGLPGSATCTVTVADTGPFTAAPGPTAPSGTVTLASNAGGSFSPSGNCALVLSAAGAASCQLTYAPTALGNQAITASYPGDILHGGSIGATALEVGNTLTVPPKLGPGPCNGFTLAKPKLNRKKGTAAITATVPCSGQLVLAGKGARRLAKHATHAGKVTLTVKPTKKSAAELHRSGKDSLRLTVTYTPTGGEAARKPEKVTLRLRRAR